MSTEAGTNDSIEKVSTAMSELTVQPTAVTSDAVVEVRQSTTAATGLFAAPHSDLGDLLLQHSEIGDWCEVVDKQIDEVGYVDYEPTEVKKPVAPLSSTRVQPIFFSPPFLASVTNVNFNAKRADVFYFFGGNEKILNLCMYENQGRFFGSCLLETTNFESLIYVLKMDEQEFMGRSVSVEHYLSGNRSGFKYSMLQLDNAKLAEQPQARYGNSRRDGGGRPNYQTRASMDGARENRRGPPPGRSSMGSYGSGSQLLVSSNKPVKVGGKMQSNDVRASHNISQMNPASQYQQNRGGPQSSRGLQRGGPPHGYPNQQHRGNWQNEAPPQAPDVPETQPPPKAPQNRESIFGLGKAADTSNKILEIQEKMEEEKRLQEQQRRETRQKEQQQSHLQQSLQSGNYGGEQDGGEPSGGSQKPQRQTSSSNAYFHQQGAQPNHYSSANRPTLLQHNFTAVPKQPMLPLSQQESPLFPQQQNRGVGCPPGGGVMPLRDVGVGQRGGGALTTPPNRGDGGGSQRESYSSAPLSQRVSDVSSANSQQHVPHRLRQFSNQTRRNQGTATGQVTAGGGGPAAGAGSVWQHQKGPRMPGGRKSSETSSRGSHEKFHHEYHSGGGRKEPHATRQPPFPSSNTSEAGKALESGDERNYSGVNECQRTRPQSHEFQQDGGAATEAPPKGGPNRSGGGGGISGPRSGGGGSRTSRSGGPDSFTPNYGGKKQPFSGKGGNNADPGASKFNVRPSVSKEGIDAIKKQIDVPAATAADKSGSVTKVVPDEASTSPPPTKTPTKKNKKKPKKAVQQVSKNKYNALLDADD